MEIKLSTNSDTDNILIIKGNGTAFEDDIIQGWYNQILKHLDKLKLKTGGEK